MSRYPCALAWTSGVLLPSLPTLLHAPLACAFFSSETNRIAHAIRFCLYIRTDEIKELRKEKIKKIHRYEKI